MKPTNTILIELQYFPSLSYFTKLLQFNNVQLEAQENYSKGSYRNRCHIAGVNSVQRLSIPLKKGKNRQQNIREVQIAHDQPWQSQHWHSIKSAYGNSPFFEFYADELNPFFKKKYAFLWDFNIALLTKTIELIGINPEISFSKEYIVSTKEGLHEIFDFRNSIHPQKSRQKEDLLFKPTRYGQVFIEKHGFLPNLSILDLLFCTGPAASEILRQSLPKNQ